MHIAYCMLSCGIFCCRLWLIVYEKRFYFERVKIYSLQLFLPHLASNCRREFSQNRMIVSFAGAGAQTLPPSWGCRKKKRNLPFFPVGMTRNTSESWNIQILTDLQGLIFDSRTKLTRTYFVVWRRVTWPNEEGGGGGGLALEAAAAQQEVLKQWGCQAGREGGDHPANISKSKDKTLAPLSSNRIIGLNKV